MPLAPTENEIYSSSVAARSEATTDGADTDPIREQLLDAAVRVFARKGYDGTRIMDIVREAGLSTGAVYGRFGSKDDLLREAVVRRARSQGDAAEIDLRVAEIIARLAATTTGPLSDDDAVRLEAYVTARREPEVADALGEAVRAWHDRLQPLLEKAVADGSVAPGVDPAAVLHFATALRLGLLAQRAAGVPAPDQDAWMHLLHLVIESFGADR